MSHSRQTELVKASLRIRDLAHAPYSNFRVGAAVLSTSGNVFFGVNVENASYGLTICAERVAICNAVAAGESRFEVLAVASSGGVTPCGACRQFMAEFCDDLPVLLVNADDESLREATLADLLPQRFGMS